MKESKGEVRHVEEKATPTGRDSSFASDASTNSPYFSLCSILIWIVFTPCQLDRKEKGFQKHFITQGTQPLIIINTGKEGGLQETNSLDTI